MTLSSLSSFETSVLETLRGLQPVPKAPPTLAEVGALWLGDVRERAELPPTDVDSLLPKTVRTYTTAWAELGRLGGMRLPATEETALKLLKRVSPGRRNAVGGALSAAYHHAGRGECVPNGRYWRYKPPVTEIEIACHQRAGKAALEGLAKALSRKQPRPADVSLACASVMVCYTGARVTEVRHARREHLVTEDGRTKLLLAAKRRTRWIPIAGALREVLHLSRPAESPWLFPGRDPAKPLGDCSLAAAHRRWGVASPQRLRRAFLSWLIAEGTDVTAVAAMAGHVSPDTLLRHYVRTSAKKMFETAEAVAQALSGAQMVLPGVHGSARAVLADAGANTLGLASVPTPGIGPRPLQPGTRCVAGGRGRA